LNLSGFGSLHPASSSKEFELSPSDYFIFREQNRTSRTSVFMRATSVSVTGHRRTGASRALRVTDGTLPLPGHSPLLAAAYQTGLIRRAPPKPSAHLRLLASQIGGDSSVIGRNIIVDGKSRQIIGAPSSAISFLDREDPAVITPFQFDRNKTHLGNSVMRVSPGSSQDHCRAGECGRARMPSDRHELVCRASRFSLKLFEDARIGPNVVLSSATSSVTSQRPLGPHGPIGMVL